MASGDDGLPVKESRPAMMRRWAFGGQQTCKRWISRERMCNAVQCCLNRSVQTKNTVISSVAYKVQDSTVKNRHHQLEPEAVVDSSSIKAIVSVAIYQVKGPSMLSLLYFLEAVSQTFGNAPGLFLSLICRYQSSSCIARMPAYHATEWDQSGRKGSKKVDGEPDPEPPAAPP